MSKQYAKEHSLDIPHFSCIEFPLKVNNIDRAFQMVGGKDAIIRACQDEVSNPLELRFTKNVYEHPINSKLSNNEQILIKVSVPKKALEANKGNVQKTLQQMHEEKKAVHITPLAIVNKTFRFREMSDFQYQAKTSEFPKTINDSLHSLNYRNIKKLDFAQDDQPWAPEESGRFELPPPPRFSSIPLPFNYQYKKNAATVMSKEGKLTIRNKHIKLHSIIIRWQDEIPQEPTEALKKQLDIFKAETNNLFFKDIVHTVDILRGLFEKKPIWIRKHIEAVLPVQLKQCLKYALPQVSYTCTKGPWRLSYIRLGVDPKSSSEYAKYQTEGFRVPNYKRAIPKNFVTNVPDGVATGFVFKGDELPISLSFQVENLQDPDVMEILNASEMREECDFHDGWYDSLTITKLRRMMRYKLRCLVDGTRIDEEKVEYIKNKLETHENDEKEDEEEDPLVLDDDEELEEEYDLDISESSYAEILDYLEKFNTKGAEEIKALSGLLKQRDLDL